MVWTAPRTWTVGEIVTAALLNTHLRDNLNSLGRDVAQIVHIGTTPFERWYAASMHLWTTGDSISSLSTTLNQLYAIPFITPRGATIDRIGFNVASGGTAGSKGRVGLYRATSQSNMYPGSLVLDGGEKDTTTTGVKSTTVSQVLEADVLYWAVLLAGTAAFSVSTHTVGLPILGLPSSLNVAADFLTVAQTYGALPATFPASASISAGTKPIIAVRYSA